MHIEHPRPWHCERSLLDNAWMVVDANGNAVARQLTRADARAIAAAPDYVDAVREVVERLDRAEALLVRA
jgi:Ethanolamine utilization protein EutJ (predicted chaperonin)